MLCVALHEVGAILSSHLSAVLATQSSSIPCGGFISLHDGSLYDTSARQGELSVKKSSCPGGDNASSPSPSPWRHSDLLLQKNVTGRWLIFVSTDNAIEVFVYNEQECERQQRFSVNGTPQACFDSSSLMKIVCVVYDHLHCRVEVDIIAAPSTVNETWTAKLRPIWSAQYSNRLTRPYLFESGHTFHLIFGTGKTLVYYTPYHPPETIALPHDTFVHELYALESRELLVAFGSSAYTYSLASAHFTPYITSPLTNLVSTDFAVTTNGSGTISATIFNNTVVQVTFSANRCGYMQVPGNAQVKFVEFFNGTVLLILTAFEHHNVLYRTDVQDIGEMLLETADSCKNISFENVSAPLLQHTDRGSHCHCRGFTVNYPLLLVNNCSSKRIATDVYVFDSKYSVQYVGALEGVTACELEAFGSSMDPTQCIHALVADSDNSTSVGNDSQSAPNTTHHPDPTSPPTSPGIKASAVTSHQAVIIGAFVAVVLVIGIVIALVVIICVCWHCYLYSKGRNKGRKCAFFVLLRGAKANGITDPITASNSMLVSGMQNDEVGEERISA